jgi:hypothetical protein
MAGDLECDEYDEVGMQVHQTASLDRHCHLLRYLSVCIGSTTMPKFAQQELIQGTSEARRHSIHVDGRNVPQGSGEPAGKEANSRPESGLAEGEATQGHQQVEQESIYSSTSSEKPSFDVITEGVLLASACIMPGLGFVWGARICNKLMHASCPSFAAYLGAPQGLEWRVSQQEVVAALRGEKLESPPFEFAEVQGKYRIHLYPKGLNEESAEYCSVFLIAEALCNRGFQVEVSVDENRRLIDVSNPAVCPGCGYADFCMREVVPDDIEIKVKFLSHKAEH